MRYRIRHETRYTYVSDVVHAHHLLHLVPRPSAYQQCVNFELTFTPAADRRHDVIDAFGNVVTRLEFEQPHRQLSVLSELEVDVHRRPPVVAGADRPVGAGTRRPGVWRFAGRRAIVLEACKFRHESPPRAREADVYRLRRRLLSLRAARAHMRRGADVEAA